MSAPEPTTSLPDRQRPYMKETGQWVPSVWCSVHDEHPNDCWELHNPTAQCGQPEEG
jgi:hypothetical protein